MDVIVIMVRGFRVMMSRETHTHIYINQNVRKIGAQTNQNQNVYTRGLEYRN